MKLMQQISMQAAELELKREAEALMTAAQEAGEARRWGTPVTEAVANNTAHAVQLLQQAMTDHHKGKSGAEAVEAAYAQVVKHAGEEKAAMIRKATQSQLES